MHLNVILRTCSNSLLTPSDKKRICGDNREVLIKKCFLSLVRSIRQSSHKVKLTVLDDNSDARFLDFIGLATKDMDCTVVNLKERGPNHSALEQFKLASESDGLVYVVEDDYLHEENAIDHMVGAYLYFMKRYNTSVVIYPYDCSLRYAEGHESQTTLHHDGIRYWRSVDKTAFTMLTHYSTIKNNWSTFETLSKDYPKVLEDDTINKLYLSADNPDASIRAFNPIPSIAYHVGYSTPVSINTTHASWTHLWDGIPEWDLIQGWFDFGELYAHVVSNLPPESTVVEVGAWRGKSTCCLGSLIRQSGKKIKAYAVDTFEGSDEEEHRKILDEMPVTLFEEFKANIEMCNVADVIEPLKMTGKEASVQFKNASVDFVMLDGAHDYESVIGDIESWLPKIKKGGLLAGDDYSKSWPGVMKAVDEKFGTGAAVRGTTWYVTV